MKNYTMVLIVCQLAILAGIGCAEGNGSDDQVPGGDTDTDTDTDTDSDTDSDSDGDTDTDTDTDTDSDTDGDSDGDTDAGGSGASCDDAFVLELNNIDGTAGTLDPPDGVHHYKLDGLKAGDFVVVWTEANPNIDLKKIDTVVSIYNADGSTLLATADDGVPWISPDSELFYRATEDGSLCVKVQEFFSWAGTAEPDKDSYDYLLVAGQLESSVNMNNQEEEPNNDEASAQQVKFNRVDDGETSFGYIFGMLDPVDDVDYFYFAMPPDNESASISVMPSGPGASGDDRAQGHGSTLELGELSLVNRSGDTVAMIDARNGSDNITLPMVEGEEVVLKVQRPSGGSVGANDFYFFKQINDEVGNPPEAETAGGNSNNTIAAAEALTFNNGSGFILGYIDPNSDVDYFSFEAKDGDSIELVCGAARNGSGLEGATFGIYSSDDNVKQAEKESLTKNVYWASSSKASKPAVSITADGTYYLRVFADGQSSDVVSNYYHCGIHFED